MPRTPDRTPGPALEEELQLDDLGADPTVVGGLTLNAGALKGKDSIGVFDLRSGTGLSEAAHKTLRHLIHFIDGGPAGGFATGAFRELTYSGSFVTAVVWWESSSKLKKIVSIDVTYTGVNPTTVVWKMFDTDGSTVLTTVTDTITYSGVFEQDRTRAIA